MNCLGCPQNKGDYKKCPYFEQKKKAIDKERENNGN